MGKPRMIQGQFGAVNYDSDTIPPGSQRSGTETVVFNENGAYLGVDRHNDSFLIPNPALPTDPMGGGGCILLLYNTSTSEICLKISAELRRPGRFAI